MISVIYPHQFGFVRRWQDNDHPMLAQDFASPFLQYTQMVKGETG